MKLKVCIVGNKVTFISACKKAIIFRSSIDEFIFHVGYQGWEAPRRVRKILARTSLHRSWFAGYSGLGILSIDELRPGQQWKIERDFLNTN